MIGAMNIATDLYLYAGDAVTFVADGFLDSGTTQTGDFKAGTTILYGHLIGLALPGEEPE